MKRLLAGAAIALAASWAVAGSAHESDRLIEQYSAYVEYVFFATGCGVFKTDAPALVLTEKHASALSYWFMQNGQPQGDYSITVAAEKAGRARAAQRGACEYWRRSPDEALRLRQEAINAMAY